MASDTLARRIVAATDSSGSSTIVTGWPVAASRASRDALVEGRRLRWLRGPASNGAGYCEHSQGDEWGWGSGSRGEGWMDSNLAWISGSGRPCAWRMLVKLRLAR